MNTKNENLYVHVHVVDIHVNVIHVHVNVIHKHIFIYTDIYKYTDMNIYMYR
jgi:hypothetical protein